MNIYYSSFQLYKKVSLSRCGGTCLQDPEFSVLSSIVSLRATSDSVSTASSPKGVNYELKDKLIHYTVNRAQQLPNVYKRWEVTVSFG